MDWFNKILKFLGFHEEEKVQLNIEIAATENPVIKEQVINAPAEEVILQVETDKVILSDDLRYITPTAYPVVLNANKQTNCAYLNGINRNDKGVMEDYFFDYAIGKLKGKLKNDVQIEVPGFTVTPDFVYADDDKKIFIVIEIDEPYSINNNGEFIPIHYKGSDDNRNKELIAMGWSIIRFAEEQIVRNPSECAKFIEQYVNNKDLNKIEAFACWTKDEADKMIKDGHRNNYLPYEFKQASLANSKSSYRSLDVSSISYRQSKKGEGFAIISIGHKIDSNTYVNTCECWVRDEDFWKKFEETSIRHIVINLDKLYYNELFCFLQPLKFEGYGKLNGNYFNLYKENEFEIIFASTAIKILNREPQFQSKKQFEQVSLELLYPIYYFEEKVKKLRAAGIKEVQVSEVDFNYKEQLNVLKKYGMAVKM